MALVIGVPGSSDRVRRAAAVAAALGAALLLTVSEAQGPARSEPAPAAVVEPRFEPGTLDRAPFPSDRLTVPDPTQRTGLRVALPLPRCATERSACDDVRLLNELDGFDLSPRLAIPFSGPIDPSSVTVRSVFLLRLVAGPPEATGVDRLVYDPETHTLYAYPEALLEPETRYGLVVTRELRDAAGRAIRPSAPYRAFLAGRGGAPAAAAYRRRLAGLLSTLARRGVRGDEIAVAAVFTTGSVSTFLEAAREALDRQPPPPALMTTPEEGGRAYFDRASLAGLTLRRQVRAVPAGLAAAVVYRDLPLPLRALPPDAVAGLGVGWFRSPFYLTAERRIAEGPTGRPPPAAPGEAAVAFVVVLPAGAPPPGGWPVAVMGHGYGGEMFGSTLLIAGTLARHGIATAGLTVVGHGGGPDSRLVVTRRDGSTLTVRVPGRGVDQNGDGTIEAVEGLGGAGRAASLGLRDGLRQQVVDLMAFTRALRGGLDVVGRGGVDLRGDGIQYVGQSLGGIYGTLWLATDPRVRAGVLNVPGGPIAEVARLAPVFRPLVRDALARRSPSLLNGYPDFREDLPLRGDGPVLQPSLGALPIQEYLARVTWLGRRGDPLAYARHLRTAPLSGLEPKRVLVQFAWGDRVVPNPATSALVRAGQLLDATALVRYDRIVAGAPTEPADPHPFLLRILFPGVAGALARAAQEQVARFFRPEGHAEGAAPWNPDEAVPRPFPEPVFEVPAASLPERLSFDPGERIMD